MTESEIKQKAKSFCKEYNLSEISYESLSAVIEKQGYTVVEFNRIVNGDNVSNLIKSLNLSDMIARSNGFTYADNNCRIVFVFEDLSEKEKLIVLAHEAGHIYLNHLASASVVGRDVNEEYEANEFSHFLIKNKGGNKFSRAFKKHKAAFIAIIVAVVLIVGGIIAYTVINTEKQYFDEYYVTETGSKYHKKDCMFVKNKKNIRRITKEEFENGVYSPCGTCLPGE